MLVYKVNLELEENEEILAEQKELQSILEESCMIGCCDADECEDNLRDDFEKNAYGIEAVVSFAIKQGWNAKKVVEDIQNSYYYDGSSVARIADADILSPKIWHLRYMIYCSVDEKVIPSRVKAAGYQLLRYPSGSSGR